MRVYTRYDLPDEKGETRRERNKKFGFDDTPDFEIPICGEYIWELFSKLSNAIHRIDFNGYYYSFPPSDIKAWCSLSNIDITPTEYEIITAMDNTFCKEINADRNASMTRKFEEDKKEIERKSKRRR